jgi:Uma2 family endonuclease
MRAAQQTGRLAILEQDMSTITSPLMTAEEFFAWNNQAEHEGHRFELQDGEIIEMPPPGELHGVLCWMVAHILGTYLFKRGSGRICTNDTGLVLQRDPDTVRGPDVMLFLASRPLDELSRTHVQEVPDLVVEVVSPTDRPNQISKRVQEYLEFGVKMVWLVEPEDQTIAVYRPDQSHQVLTSPDELTGRGVLPEFAHRVGDFFAIPGQNASQKS